MHRPGALGGVLRLAGAVAAAVAALGPAALGSAASAPAPSGGSGGRAAVDGLTSGAASDARSPLQDGHGSDDATDAEVLLQLFSAVTARSGALVGGSQPHRRSPGAPSLHSGAPAPDRSALIESISRSEECDLCGGEQQWLLVLGTGRSGSTSVLEMMNAIPGYYLAGENMGAMKMLMDLHGQILASENSSMHVGGPTKISERAVLCGMQDYMRALIGYYDEATTSVIGFKEIRHNTVEELDFFRKVFPCGRYVINFRENTKKQRLSTCTEFGNCHNIDGLERDNEVMKTWQAQHSSDSFLMSLEDFSVDRFNQLLAWLDVTGCYYTEVARANTDLLGYNRDNVSVSGECSLHQWVSK